MNNDQGELYNSQILHTIRSIVDELYEINHQESSLVNEPREKRVRFTLQQETDKTELPMKNMVEKEKSSIKYQRVLSESATVVCCLSKGRSKVDCSVSTNDLPSRQCESATQTIDIPSFSTYNHSSMSLLTRSDSLSSIGSRSNIASSTTWISSKPTFIPYRSSFSTRTPSLHWCENTTIIPTLSTAHQLVLPSEVKLYNICQEQIPENYNTFITSHPDLLSNDHRNLLNESITETDVKLCTCSKRKLSDNHFPIENIVCSNQDKLLEELHLSNRSLQSMHNDGLFYIHDLVLLFLRHTSQFHQILSKTYYVPQKRANLFVKTMNKWWKKHRTKFNDINKKFDR